ncbi:MAG: hypothetical protein WCW03_01715 [Candidatus Paceibacterota bacterium]|jgi:hypothetical protein
MKNSQKGFVVPLLIIVVVLIVVIVVYIFIKGAFYPFPPEQPDQTYTLKCPGVLGNQSAFNNLFGASVANAMTQQPLFVGKLCFIDEPLLNKPAVLEFRFVSRSDAAVSVSINLPKEIQVVSGNTEWRGDLKYGQQQSFKVTVRPTKIGYYHISGSINGGDNSRPQIGGPVGIDLDVTSNGTIINPVWNKTFSSSNALYSAVYPENSSWTVRPISTDSRFTEYDFGHELSSTNFEPIISVTYYQTGYVDNQQKNTGGGTEININKKDLKTKVWTYSSAMRQTVTSTDGKSVERVTISNWNGYDIRIDLLKAEYLPAYDKFVELFTITS